MKPYGVVMVLSTRRLFVRHTCHFLEDAREIILHPLNLTICEGICTVVISELLKTMSFKRSNVIVSEHELFMEIPLTLTTVLMLFKFPPTATLYA